MIYNLVLLNFVFYFLVATIWRVYETKVIGKVSPDKFHTFIAMLFSFSLALNVLYWMYQD